MELQHQVDQMDSKHLVADFLCSVVQNLEQGLLCEHKVCLMVIAAKREYFRVHVYILYQSTYPRNPSTRLAPWMILLKHL